MKPQFYMSSNIKNKKISNENTNEVATSIYKNAESYYLVSINAMQTLFPKAMPAITVNAVFSCELFIKSILTLENRQFNKGHLIHQLFCDIKDNSLKSRIISNLSNCGYDFDSYIKEISNAFSISRYIYEYEVRSCDLSFVLSLSKALYTECSQLFNEENNNV